MVVTRWITHALTLVVLGVVSPALLSGCNIASAVGYAVHPEPEFEAEYTLANVPTVVFIDDRRGVVNPTRLRRVIADEATAQLMEEGVISQGNMISPRDAMIAARRSDRSGDVVPIAEIAELVGADQVIYVDVNQFKVTFDGVTPDPTSIVRIRVLDIATGKRVFPDPDAPDGDSGYFQLTADMPNAEPHGFNTIKVRNEMTEQLALQTGDRIAKLFYTYMQSELGSRMGRSR